MNVILDVSFLGLSRRHSMPQTGIFRVVERLAQGLAGAPECRLSFSATGTLEAGPATYDYLRSNPHLKNVPLLGARPHQRRRQQRFFNALAPLNARLESGSDIKAMLAARQWRDAAREVQLPRRALRHLLSAAGSATYLHAADRRTLQNADVFHSTLYALPPHLRLFKRMQKLLTVYDLTPLLHPQLHVGRVDHFTGSNLRSVRRDDWFACISQATKNDLCNYLKLDAARVFVTPLAASRELFHPCDEKEKSAEVRRKYLIPDGPYFLSVNTLEPRKNIAHVVHCFAQLVRQERLHDVSLVLAGAKGWLFDDIFNAIAGYKELQNRIVATGFVEDEDLAPLYSGARAFIYPSLYEGFGLPPLEAMQCGAPVVTSNTSSLPEVVGDAGITLDPSDADALSQTMLKLLRDAALCETMSEKSLRRAEGFSWERCVSQTLAAYKTASGA